MPTPTPAVRLVGRPPIIRTGRHGWADRFSGQLRTGFDPEDAQTLNAPESLPRGSVSSMTWTAHDGQVWGLYVADVRRPQ